MIYSITEQGLKRDICLYPGCELYYGYSDSPNAIIVKSVNENRVFFVYRMDPTNAIRTEQKVIFEDLAFKGSMTWLRNNVRTSTLKWLKHYTIVCMIWKI